MSVFWDVALCSLVEVYRRFTDAYCLLSSFIALILEAVSTSETSFSIYKTARYKIPEDIFLLAAVIN
jgi:hypothetical protein